MSAPLPIEIVTAIRNAYAAGEGPKSIASRLGVGTTSVKRWARDTEQQRPQEFIDPGDITWQDQAACIGCDVDLFVPDTGYVQPSVRQICEGCSVSQRCLEYGLLSNSVGLWGGQYLSPKRPEEQAA